MTQFLLICSMCQTYSAHVFPMGCARHPTTACSQLGSSVRLSYLVPHLGAVVASIGTFSRAGVYTLVRVCVCQCSVTMAHQRTWQ